MICFASWEAGVHKDGQIKTFFFPLKKIQMHFSYCFMEVELKTHAKYQYNEF